MGASVLKLERRAKYLLAHLDRGETLIMHLGMSGRFLVDTKALGVFHQRVDPLPHTHVELETDGSAGAFKITYADPRRFGFMDLVRTDALDQSRHFAGMGPEPLSETFTPDVLRRALAGRAVPLKSALLDQKVVGGLGNIYVCEALYLAGLSPRRRAATVGPGRAAGLVVSIKQVLTAAVAAGGSSLKDFAAADGALGYFQHSFSVYDREGEACRQCDTPITRIVQSGRSTFFCGRCQR